MGPGGGPSRCPMLQFDIDAAAVLELAAEFEASDEELYAAYNRALRRTAANLKTKARKELRVRLGLRSAGVLRRRLQDFKLRRDRGSGAALGSVSMWFGFNDLPASAFKGRPRATATGAAIGEHEVEGGFVAKNRAGRPTIMRRRTRARFPIVEATLPVVDRMQVIVEDEIFDALEEVFFKNLRAEIRSRTIYGVGKARRSNG